jgi:hypothetical protein
MSDLKFSEKQKFERLFGMGSGYVLNFSNRTFREFILDSTGKDIDEDRYNYASGSKANRLRAFWQKETNAVVGKLMSDLLDYTGERSPLEGDCRLIVARLLHNGSVTHAKTVSFSAVEDSSALLQPSQKLARLRDDFLQLAAQSDRAKAGFALERLLNELFGLFQLHPRQPFRVVGEQIDGSFELDNQIYLLELKWEKGPLPEAPLLVFRGKIEGKSTFTRGVFLALNDISADAKDAVTRGKSPSFFVMNGHDLMMILSDAISLPDYLRKRVRLLAEEGRVCVPFGNLS